MKMLIVTGWLLFAFAAFAQKPVSFDVIDEHAKYIEPAAPAQLAYTLTKDYLTETEKLRSIFTWVTEHISYRVKRSYHNIQVNNPCNYIINSDSGKYKSANDFMAEIVLMNESAFCDGYARLFKTLCDYAGLRCVIINGFANGDYNRRAKFRCNHSWNAVYINNAWQLLDVTWASGYTNYSGSEFFKHYNDDYFMTPPEKFIRDHFPDDLRWTLMQNPPFPAEFKNGPFKNRAFTKYKINSYMPAGGIIEATVGDTIQIEIESADTLSDSKMAADSAVIFDSSLQKLNTSVAFLEPQSGNQQKLHYTFVAENNNIEWLCILYNQDVILRYRLQIKKEKANLAVGNKMSMPVVPANP